MNWVGGVVEAYGYLGIALLVALENVITVIPSELILPLAGYLAARGQLWLPGVILAATVGSLAGASILYGAGYWLGEDRLRSVVRKYGRWVFLHESDLVRAHAWFRRHGGNAVLIGRLVPAVRSLISIPAGTSRMCPVPFVIYTTLGSIVWNSVLVGLGWLLGEQWTIVQEYARWLELLVLIAIVAIVIWFVWRRVRARAQ